MLATDMTSSGSPEEKLRWAFKMYDKDGSGLQINKNSMRIRLISTGEIELKEMVEIVGTLYEMEGMSKVGCIFSDSH